MPRTAHDFHEFFRYANFFYGTIGMEPYTHRQLSLPHKIMVTLIFYINFVNMNLVLLLEFVYVFMSAASGENTLEAIMSLAYIGFVLVASVKTFIVWRQKAAINDFVRAIRRIYPHTLEEQENYRLIYCFNECLHLSRTVSGIYIFAVWIFNLVAICQHLISKYIHEDVYPTQELPYYMYITWEWRCHWSYYVLYLMQCLAGHTSGVGHFASDLLLCSFVTQLVIHFQYVSRLLREYRVKVGHSKMNQDRAHAVDLEFLKNIIQYHNYLLELAQYLNQIFEYPLTVNFGTSALVICFVGFQMTAGGSALNLFKLSLFLMAMFTQATLICYYGQLLMDASLNVAQAVYEQNWFTADLRYRKMLILIARRAQKPAQLRATALIPVSRGTMTELIQISYKCFALLRTLYG